MRAPLILIAAAALFVSVSRGGEAPAKVSKPYKIAVIPKGTTHSFWKSIHAGAEKASQDLGVEIIWQGPQKEDDRAMQIQVVQNFVARGVDAIVLAPLDDTALVRPVRDATRRGIKVVIIDSDLNSEDHISFVATDNFKGGQLAARRLGEIMGGKGKAIMMRYSEGSASTHNREEGFLEVMAKEFPEIELLSTNQYGGVTSESAFQRGQNLLNQYGAQVDGIFCPNESSAFGMLRALQTSGKAGVVKFVGFDISPALYKGFQDGQINGLTVQNPFRMGYLGVQTAVQALEGQDVEKRIDTGAVMVTPENIDDPNVREAVDPQLKQ